MVLVKKIDRMSVAWWVPIATAKTTITNVAGASTMNLTCWANRPPTIKLTMQSQIVT
jgi:hypothetical protein